MNNLSPIFTEQRECQDCYKCVRTCPVKAIKVEGGYASVISAQCVFCGQCVAVCPNGAKRVRDDLPAAERLLTRKEKVLVSLAPSFVSEFPTWRPAQLIRSLRALGFYGVSETALGAQQVSAQAAALHRAHPERVLLSSACPTVVSYLQKHRLVSLPQLTGLLSPMLAHAVILREQFGAEIGIVFIGPCIAKKIESDQHPELVDVVLTFDDLRRWFKQAEINPEDMLESASDHFIPERAEDGAWYPIEGGMIAGLKSTCAVNDRSCMSFSGITGIEKALCDLEGFKPDQGLFIELLACEGGCINGPRTAQRGATAVKRYQILRTAPAPQTVLPRATGVNLDMQIPATPALATRYPDSQIREALRLVGKYSAEDEMNCGGCGYDSCRAFAAALIDQKAERSMCVTFMRKLAQKKAHALIQKMPAAVVIVNESLHILEHNAAFAALFGSAPAGGNRSAASLENTPLSACVPFASLFHSVLKSGEDILDRDLRLQETFLQVSIFTIERHSIVGGILEDITKPAVHKEQVIRKVREIIQKNLNTVQEIAFLLGENASESEIALHSIMESFLPRKSEEGVPTMTGETFIDVDFCQRPKHGQRICGDVHLTRKLKEEARIVTVLSDGLGSGVKAAVLSSLTATMALRYSAAIDDVRRGAGMIMDTLPVCKERKISYSTFTIVDLHEDGRARVIEHGNPPLVLLRGTELQSLDRTQFTLDKWKDRTIQYSEFEVELGDRLVFCTDGINQSGMGRRGFPLGWGTTSVSRFVSQQIAQNRELSAAELASSVIQVALTNDGDVAKDDMTCGVIYFRRPRRLLLISGPPFNSERDRALAEMIRTFPGKKAICGGTTASIISRHLGRPVKMSLARPDPEVPPASAMEGVDLVTEGTLTLARVAETLERHSLSPNDRPNPARELAALMLASDIIHFVVGTRINDAHQDPSVPVELDLRRNIVRKIAGLLEREHLKETQVQFI